MRFKTADIAPAVDKVIGEQLVGLANALGGALPPTRDEKAAEEPAADTPEVKEEPGSDAAVAALVEKEPNPAPDENSYAPGLPRHFAVPYHAPPTHWRAPNVWQWRQAPPRQL